MRLVAACGVYFVLVYEAPALDEPSRRPAVPQLAGLVAVAPSAAADVLVGLRGKVRQFVLHECQNLSYECQNMSYECQNLRSILTRQVSVMLPPSSTVTFPPFGRISTWRVNSMSVNLHLSIFICPF